jgi:hypothetical protein
MAVQGAAEHAAQQRVPGLAGALTMRVLAGLRGMLRSGVDRPLTGAEELVAEAVQDVKGMARRAAEQAARSAVAGVTRWQRLGPDQVSALESMALAAAEGAACKAVEAAGRVSLTLLAEAEAARQSPSSLWARTAARMWIRWLAARRGGPPAFAEGLLSWILPERERNHLLADLDEEFEAHILPKCGSRGARAWYWRQALRSIVPAGRMRLAALLGRLLPSSPR